jgi:hypothetical protein
MRLPILLLGQIFPNLSPQLVPISDGKDSKTLPVVVPSFI